MARTIRITLPEPLSLDGVYRPPLLARWAVKFAVVVTQWDMKRRTRRQLARLDQHLLSDIGMTRDAACTEAARPFWR